MPTRSESPGDRPPHASGSGSRPSATASRASLTLARDGYRSRVSDVLNASERDFITLTEVTVAPLDGGPIELHPYLSLARRHIVFAVAAGDDAQ